MKLLRALWAALVTLARYAWVSALAARDERRAAERLATTFRRSPP